MQDSVQQSLHPVSPTSSRPHIDAAPEVRPDSAKWPLLIAAAMSQIVGIVVHMFSAVLYLARWVEHRIEKADCDRLAHSK